LPPSILTSPKDLEHFILSSKSSPAAIPSPHSGRQTDIDEKQGYKSGFEKILILISQ